MESDAPRWWQTGVIYQIYPRSFQASSGGVGDLEGVVRRLDYLAWTLGVQAIWLSPFFRSPMKDFGYDVSDHCDVDPIFGDLAAFDRLLAGCHARGLRLIIDYVPNHTSDQHPWFAESRAGRDSPRRAWYVWADPKPDGGPPNNWLSPFGGSAWERDERSSQYYLHTFLAEQPDLDWRNPAVERAMFDVLRFWLDRGVDGFRIDVAHLCMKDPLLRDNPPTSPRDKGYRRSRGAYDEQLHLHDRGHSDIHPLFRRLRRLLDSYDDDRFAVGEIHIHDWGRWVSYYGEDLDELQMPFNFSLLEARWEAAAVREKVDALEAALPPGAWPNYVLGNHDEPRVASRYGRAQARIAAALLLTLRGTPTLYNGDELGMTDLPLPTASRDPAGADDPRLSRDPCRAPLPWSDGPNAGFAPPGVEPWLPLPADHPEINVERQLGEPRSLLQLYRRLLALRGSERALREGSYRPLDEAPGCFAYERRLGERRLLVALNFTDRPLRLRRALPDGAELLLSTTLDPDRRLDGALRPDEGLIISSGCRISD